MQIMRLVYLKGGGLGDPLDPLLAPPGFASFFNRWAVLGYRRKD
jgi:hypothetical protein